MLCREQIEYLNLKSIKHFPSCAIRGRALYHLAKYANYNFQFADLTNYEREAFTSRWDSVREFCCCHMKEIITPRSQQIRSEASCDLVIRFSRAFCQLRPSTLSSYWLLFPFLLIGRHDIVGYYSQFKSLCHAEIGRS